MWQKPTQNGRPNLKINLKKKKKNLWKLAAEYYTLKKIYFIIYASCVRSGEYFMDSQYQLDYKSMFSLCIVFGLHNTYWYI